MTLLLEGFVAVAEWRLLVDRISFCWYKMMCPLSGMKTKRVSNLEKRGFDFAEIEVEFDWTTATLDPSRGNRVMALGILRGVVVIVIFAALGSEAISVISVRRASSKERDFYAKARERI